MRLVADTSALIAILNAETDQDIFLEAFHNADQTFMSAASVFEAHCVCRREQLPEGSARLAALIDEIRPEIASFDTAQMAIAKEAYSRFGRGTGHPAKLNIGDCFPYALAKSLNLPLLFKGADFGHTDIEPVAMAS